MFEQGSFMDYEPSFLVLLKPDPPEERLEEKRTTGNRGSGSHWELRASLSQFVDLGRKSNSALHSYYIQIIDSKDGQPWIDKRSVPFRHTVLSENRMHLMPRGTWLDCCRYSRSRNACESWAFFFSQPLQCLIFKLVELDNDAFKLFKNNNDYFMRLRIHNIVKNNYKSQFLIEMIKFDWLNPVELSEIPKSRLGLWNDFGERRGNEKKKSQAFASVSKSRITLWNMYSTPLRHTNPKSRT